MTKEKTKTTKTEKTQKKSSVRAKKPSTTSKKTDVKVTKPEEVKVAPVEVVTERKELDANDYITCVNVTIGDVIFIANRSGMTYEWFGEGDTVEVRYGDLLELKAKRSKILTAPFIMIDDEQIAKDWKLDGVYEYYKKYAGENIKEFFDLDGNVMAETLKSAPEGFCDYIVNKAAELLRHGEMDSINTLAVIDSVLGTNLRILI